MPNVHPLVPGENPAQLESLRAEYHESCKPVGPLETHAVDTMIDAKWQLRRLSRMENGTYRLYAITLKDELAELPNDPDLHLAFTLHYDGTHGKVLKHIAQQQARLHRLYAQSLKDLQKLQTARQPKDCETVKGIANPNTHTVDSLPPEVLDWLTRPKQTQSPEPTLRP